MEDETPGWAFSIGLYKNFNHPEIVVFGLNDDLMHSLINSIGEDVRAGKRFVIDNLYPDLIEAYSCTFKPVNQVWYHHFLGYANWFQKRPFSLGTRLQSELMGAQPLLFNEEPASARTTELLKSME